MFAEKKSLKMVSCYCNLLNVNCLEVSSKIIPQKTMSNDEFPSSAKLYRKDSILATHLFQIPENLTQKTLEDFTNTLYRKFVTANTFGIQAINQQQFGLISPIKPDSMRFHIRNKTPTICASQQNFPLTEEQPRSSVINKIYKQFGTNKPRAMESKD